MPKTDQNAYVVIQEGGSSTELYIHALETMDAAITHRMSCAEGAYRTSQVIEIPVSLVEHPEFFSSMEKILAGTLAVDYP